MEIEAYCEFQGIFSVEDLKDFFESDDESGKQYVLEQLVGIETLYVHLSQGCDVPWEKVAKAFTEKGLCK